MQIYIGHDALNEIEMTDNCIHLIFNVKALQKCHLCVLRENSSTPEEYEQKSFP